MVQLLRLDNDVVSVLILGYQRQRIFPPCLTTIRNLKWIQVQHHLVSNLTVMLRLMKKHKMMGKIYNRIAFLRLPFLNRIILENLKTNQTRIQHPRPRNT